MKSIILFFTLLALTLTNVSFAEEACQLPGGQGRNPASSNPCDTAGELMSLNLAQKEFSGICKKIVSSDPACQKLKPEKRLTCTHKGANSLAFEANGNGFANRIFQCVKGFVWDSMVELVKFVGDLIGTLVGSAVKNKDQIIKFLIDPFYRNSVLGKGAVKGGKLGAAFLKSSYSYVAREYPKNLLRHPFSPILALGETLAKPLVSFLTEAVQSIVAEYVPQYQCMNGAAKLNTICRIAGEFVMPPAFVFNYLKFGIKGLKALAKGSQVARFRKNFTALNELTQVEKKASLVVTSTAKAPAPKALPKPKPKPAVVVRAEKAKPITKHTDDELIVLARKERAEAKRAAASEEAEKILVDEKFEGKDAFLDYQKSVAEKRSALDSAFPLETHFDVGLESPHMTMIAEPSKLVGKKIIGVESTYVGTYQSPLVSASVRPYEGTVKKVINHGNDLYPDYVATIILKDGKTTTVSLTHSRGLRTPKGTAKGPNPYKKAEALKESQRVKATREKFVRENPIGNVTPEAWVPSEKIVAEGLSSLSAADRAKILNFREKLLAIISDNPEYEYLARGDLDRSVRPLTELKNEKYRAVAEEAQRLMNDTTSKDGFNNWFIDLMTEAMVDKAKKGSLKWGTKESTLADVHFNYPWAEGAHGLPSKLIKIEEFPVIKDEDLIALLDKRIKRAGFDDGFKDIKLEVPMAPGTKNVAVLKGENLDETTPLFIAYTKGNIQFLDDYFVGKPHGVYSHILQNLYMADRFIEPSKNAFGRNMYKQFLEMQTSIVEDSVAATRYNDYVGLRSPANPDHVNNMLKLTITDDVKLKYVKKTDEVKEIAQPLERLSKTPAFKKQSVTVAMSETPKIPVKGELDYAIKANSKPSFKATSAFDKEIAAEATAALKSLPTTVQSKVYLVLKPESGKITVVSPDLTAKELTSIKNALETKSSALQMLGSQAATKINRHLKITFDKNLKIEMLRPDEDAFIFQNVQDQTFGAWKTMDNGESAFPISMVDKRSEPILQSAQKENLVDWDIIEEFEPQAYRTFCGLASVCSVIRKDAPGMTQEQIMLNNAIFKKPQEVVGLEGMNPGYELDNLAKIAENNGKMSLVVRATEEEAEGVARLREDILESLKGPGKKMIANYDGVTLGGKTAGHYSPVAGFDPVTDKVLVLDVALHRNESFWIPVKNLYQAMMKKDAYGFARGYIKLEDRADALEKLPWKNLDDVVKMPGLSPEDAKFLKGFLSGVPKELQERLLIKFQTQSSEATLKDLESMRDLSKINGECR